MLPTLGGRPRLFDAEGCRMCSVEIGSPIKPPSHTPPALPILDCSDDEMGSPRNPPLRAKPALLFREGRLPPPDLEREVDEEEARIGSSAERSHAADLHIDISVKDLIFLEEDRVGCSINDVKHALMAAAIEHTRARHNELDR